MAEPLSWRVLEHVAAIVARIRVADGYHSDLGAGVVTLDSARVDEDTTQPYTTIVAGPIDTDEASSGPRTVRGSMDVVIDYAVPLADGINAELLAHRGRADIVRAVLSDNHRDRPDGLLSLKLSGSQVGEPETGAAVVIAQVTVRAGLSESFSPA